MVDHNDLKLTDYQALAEFRYQLRCFLRFSEKAAREAGLEPQPPSTDAGCKGQRRRRKDAHRLSGGAPPIQHHSAVELVDRLAKKGLITRSRSDKDRREVHVQLTTHGERLLGELTRHTRAELCWAAPALVATLRKLTNTAARSRRAPAKLVSSRVGKP